MINIISKTKYTYAFSITLSILGIISLMLWGMKFGIDFTGGTLMEVKFANTIPAKADIESLVGNLNLKSLTIQTSENNSDLIRYASEDDTVNEKVWSEISQKYPDAVQLKVDYTNSSVSQELRNNSLWAIFWAVLGIMAYIAWAFRKVSRPIPSWKFGLGAVIALIHDILITVGIFSILGHFLNIEVGVPFIAALLTILGFSVHDTIVVYDRTRENLLRSGGKEPFPDLVNRSLNETVIRSINTSFTVMITLLAIFLFGGSSIKDFSLALLIGIFFGTYSSIFIASALLVTSYKLQTKKS